MVETFYCSITASRLEDQDEVHEDSVAMAAFGTSGIFSASTICEIQFPSLLPKLWLQNSLLGA
jgi:hypothetical protein